MQGRAQMWMLLWLAFCLLEHSHSLVFPFAIPFFAPSYSNQQDVDAVNELYASLGSPDLRGWAASGGDPCEEAWQGVQCLGPNITEIVLKGVGLEGKLSEALGKLTSITRLDLSSNNLAGELPESMAMLKSLSALHVQNNRLTGTLDVLRDLPLKDLNVEHNQFAGSIPDKMLNIPKFLRNGNHLTIPIPGSSPSSPSPAAHPHITVIPAVTPQDTTPGGGLGRHANKVSPTKAAGFSILAASLLTVAVVVTVFTTSRRRQEMSTREGHLRAVVRSVAIWTRKTPKLGTAANPDKQHCTAAANDIVGSTPGDYTKAAGLSAHTPLKNYSMSSIVSDKNVQWGSEDRKPSTVSFKFFTVASLQQCTNSFSGENFLRETRFGKIFLGERPDCKFAVLKLCDTATKMAADEFLENVRTIADLGHPSIEELVGCCVEHGQRLLVYKHFSEHTLDDLIHRGSSDAADPGNKFLWEARIAMALEVAKALEYLHGGGGSQEGHVAVVHGHFRPEHVLVDGEARVRVSGCSLSPFASLVASGTTADWTDDTLSYVSSPEEAATTEEAATGRDVYCFGVVMLQLLTGRMPYDNVRPRGERLLVPWAGARLHDLSALRRMADPRLRGTPVPVRSLSRFADIISRCVQREAEFRPAMAEVVQDLMGTSEEARMVDD
ncbi:protein STRUBBELIG-RECEPTOR FAMILY 3-like isoform X2 [Hordeum vulgare subsp. vulgare]|uniref:Protein kinase domain-containing protein n=1 Tax=Hordeum vulgare subsp. vulgare TaxID=112509 RepID=A0A8I6YRP8_HORVV|nr:protein STRUBBELIG-RECEPTOR FAMILY 3-like isoform X2 [Hordeum vulgare subsp. vulgare]